MAAAAPDPVLLLRRATACTGVEAAAMSDGGSSGPPSRLSLPEVATDAEPKLGGAGDFATAAAKASVRAADKLWALAGRKMRAALPGRRQRVLAEGRQLCLGLADRPSAAVERKRAEWIFRCFDRDGDGLWSYDEACEAAQCAGTEPMPPGQWEEFCRGAGADPEGGLSPSVVYRCYASGMAQPARDMQLAVWALEEEEAEAAGDADAAEEFRELRRAVLGGQDYLLLRSQQIAADMRAYQEEIAAAASAPLAPTCLECGSREHLRGCSQYMSPADQVRELQEELRQLMADAPRPRLTPKTDAALRAKAKQQKEAGNIRGAVHTLRYLKQLRYDAAGVDPEPAPVRPKTCRPSAPRAPHAAAASSRGPPAPAPNRSPGRSPPRVSPFSARAPAAGPSFPPNGPAPAKRRRFVS
eukprot:TRINITY_DN36251_c0_g1_i1.p1 TRINITY_DN36251_c0_g1~~TRINITY_DN36251_c0_g1_i1.p1  ORF type:complete len:413 (+),score=133.20 TRINITY_DN36251_c0_g1_i1:59-1297(+)